MSKKASIFYTLVVIVLAFSISSYYISSSMYHNKTKNKVSAELSNIEEIKKEKNIEFVGDYTLKKVKDNKAYFMETLPTYLPGRTGDNSIDIRYYKTSRFKEGVNFKLIRVYTEDRENNPIHKYRFEAVPTKK
ncbi:hypothetical protein [Staphylococcus phage vB_ScaM-V1SC04]|nr:hypothetical protein [Staphylococcus phage vB_ScaM-V1SC04]